MAQTFWTGSSLSFTNGSKIVTVNTGPSVDSIYPNSKLKSGNYNEPVEVKAAYGSTIELYENWPGSTANTSATVTPSSAAAAAAGVAAQQVVTEIQNLVGSASATATANSFVKRDSNGRIKAATPSANDDVVTKGYFQTGSALSAAGIFHEGNSVNPLSYGLSLVTNNGMRDAAGSIVNDLNLAAQPNQFFVFDSATTNRPITHQGLTIPNGVGITMSRDANIWGQLTISRAGASLGETVIRAKDGTNIKERTVFDSGNTNFNEFEGNGVGDTIATGFMASNSVARLFLPISSFTPPTSITATGEFIIRQVDTNISANIPATSITLSGGSSNKIMILEISGLSGTIEKPCALQVQNTSSKLTVNF